MFLRFILMSSFLMLALTTDAQTSSASFTLEELTKTAVTTAEGDMNHDGWPDIVLIAMPDTVSHQPVLAIYWGTPNGILNCFRQYDNVLPEDEGGLVIQEYFLKISDKGVLTISKGSWASAGSWAVESVDYVYRYQNGDFFLIGMDRDCFMRNSGDGEHVSCNYLTRREQRRTYNEFDESVKPRETWRRLPKAPLRRLGDGMVCE